MEVRYHFSQRFAVAAQKAFHWCTDFEPKDHLLMGDGNAERHLSLITVHTLILKDIFHLSGGALEKQKLVHLYPEELSWTSTHLTGPNKYSQFLYQITSLGEDSSILHFTAVHVEHDEKADAKLLAGLLCKEDAAAWTLLAKAMAEEQKTYWGNMKPSKKPFS